MTSKGDKASKWWMVLDFSWYDRWEPKNIWWELLMYHPSQGRNWGQEGTENLEKKGQRDGKCLPRQSLLCISADGFLRWSGEELRVTGVEGVRARCGCDLLHCSVLLIFSFDLRSCNPEVAGKTLSGMEDCIVHCESEGMREARDG